MARKWGFKITVATCLPVDRPRESFGGAPKKKAYIRLHPGSITLESLGVRPRYQCWFCLFVNSASDSDVHEG